MADTKLFNIKGTVKEYQSGTVTLEKEIRRGPAYVRASQ